VADVKIPDTTSVGPPVRQVAGQVRSGPVPYLADCFRTRTDSAQGLLGALSPGKTLVLTPPGGQGDPANGRGGGTGKTQLAAFAAESLWQSGDIDLLIWVVAASRDSILTGLVQAFTRARGPDPGDGAQAVAARFVAWLAETDRQWLLVLDDLADAADLEGLWPEGPAGRVLITTTNPAGVGGERGAQQFPVGAFSPREALNYMMMRLSADPDQRSGVADLVEDLARWPLALAQASALIATSGQSCRTYCEQFARRRTQIARTTGVEPSAAAVTWTLSLEEADRLAPPGAAQQVLALTALLDCHGIPGAVLSRAAASGNGAAGAADPALVRAALVNLERTGLVTIDPENVARTVQLSPVVQAAVQGAMPPQLRDRAASAAASGLLQAWPEQDTEPWLALALRSCVTSLRQAAPDSLWAAGGYPLLSRAGRSLSSARLTGPAVGYWQDLAVTSDRMLGPGGADTVAARGRLAQALVAARRAPEALRLYEGILDAQASTHGPEHPDTLAVQLTLGRTLMDADRAGDAISVFEKVVSTCDRVRGPDHPDTLSAQDGLAGAFLAMGRFKEATQLYQRTLAARERSQAKQHPDTLAARANLADAYRQAGRLKEAFPHYKRALADRARLLGADHPDTIAVRGSLAAAYHQARRLKDAIPLYERTLSDRERVQGLDHPDTIGARGNLASAYHSAGRIATALGLYERTRSDCERILGGDNPDTLASRANLAHAYHALGRNADAVSLLRKTAADCERVLPPGDPLTRAVQESLQAVADG
jgi:tetratricopeptide (TPR) repeat protein